MIQNTRDDKTKIEVPKSQNETLDRVEDLFLQPELYGYHTFQIRKRNGKMRQITAPSPHLKALQKGFLSNYGKELDRERHHCDVGFREGKSITDATMRIAAKTDLDKCVIISIDLKDFFSTVKLKRVHRILRDVVGNRLAFMFAKAVCHQGRLPQGSPCSPVLAAIAAKTMDKQIASLTEDLYSRYADDLTVAIPLKEEQMYNRKTQMTLASDMITKLIKIIGGQGFKISRDKIKVSTTKRASVEIVGARFRRKSNKPLQPKASTKKLARLFNFLEHKDTTGEATTKLGNSVVAVSKGFTAFRVMLNRSKPAWYKGKKGYFPPKYHSDGFSSLYYALVNVKLTRIRV